VKLLNNSRTACRTIQLNRSAVEKSAKIDEDQWWKDCGLAKCYDAVLQAFV
jgi:hypothetical protein